MNFGPRFDAVLSNAALHWMKDADAVIGRVARALLPKGAVRTSAQASARPACHRVI
jgi:hypothetical protein